MLLSNYTAGLQKVLLSVRRLPRRTLNTANGNVRFERMLLVGFRLCSGERVLDGCFFDRTIQTHLELFFAELVAPMTNHLIFSFRSKYPTLTTTQARSPEPSRIRPDPITREIYSQRLSGRCIGCDRE